MFNKKDASFEIAESMQRALVSSAVAKETAGLDKLDQAMEHLNAAAEIFDGVGLKKHAEAATQLLESLAAKKSKKKKKPTKSKSSKTSKRHTKRKSSNPTKGLTSEKMLDNLEHKGWVFNADDDMSFADDAHDEDCMCSSCCNDYDMNYVNHGHDCVCDMCMDADDDMNDAKLGVSGDFGSSVGSPEYWRHMAAKYTREGNLQEAEKALTKAMKAEYSDDYDKDSSDRSNAFDFSFIDDEPKSHRDAIPPPPPSEDEDVIDLVEMPDFEPETRSWESIKETGRDTWPATPAAKRHRRELEEQLKPGGVADQMDDLGFEWDPRMY